MQSNVLIVIGSLVFKVTDSYIVKWGKSRFDLNVGISCWEATRARMKPSHEFCPQTAVAASVTSLTCLSTACVWHGNFGKMKVGVTSVPWTSVFVHCDVQLGPALVCVVDSPSSWPRTDSPVSEVRVAVNDWVNDLLVLRAEVSILDEHLVKVPSSVFAWVGFYGKPHWSIYANDVRHQRLQILGWFFVADI